MRAAGLAGALAAAALALAGCGGSADPAAEPSYEGTADATGEPKAGPSATAAPEEGLASERARALEKLAAAAQSQAAVIESATAVEPRTGSVLGADISWPQCPEGHGIPHKETLGLPLPTAEAEYVLIGLTNGPGFHANPCLADQVAWAKGQGLLVAAYSVISWPDDAAQQRYGGLHEAGRAQAEFNLASMRAAGLDSPIIWLDVEQVPHYEWPADPAANAEVVLGAAEGYVDAGYRVGVYSTPHIWDTIVGELSLGVPEWRAAGQTSMAEALSRCGPDWSIQGGEAVLGQWVEDRRDRNVTCPGVSTDLGKWLAAPPAG